MLDLRVTVTFITNEHVNRSLPTVQGGRNAIVEPVKSYQTIGGRRCVDLVFSVPQRSSTQSLSKLQRGIQNKRNGRKWI